MTPQKEAGQTIEPPVDSASAICLNGAFAVKPAAPPEEPPHVLSLSWGFNGTSNPRPTLTLKEPKPNSSCEVLPIINAPSSRAFSTAVASKTGLYPFRM